MPLGAITWARGAGLGDRGGGVAFQGQVVVDLARLGQDAAVAVVGVLVEAGVRHDHQGVADLCPEVCQGELDDPRGVVRAWSPGRP